jgi:uncharacterized membrane protein
LASGRQLNDLRKQIIDVTDKLDVTERKTMLGVPRRKRQPDWAQLARYGAAAIAAVAGSQLLSRGKEKASEKAGQLADRGRAAAESASDKATALADEGRETADAATDRAKELADEGKAKGKEAAQQATEKGRELVDEGREAAPSSTDGDQGDSGLAQSTKQRLIIQHQIDIAVPRRVVYDKWSRFVDLTGASSAVHDITQEDDAAASERDQILFATRSWDAEVVEHVPERRIGWESSGQAVHRGVATFHELADDLTRAQVEMEYHPQGDVDDVGDLFHTIRQRVEKDLRLFKHHLEFEVGASAGSQGGGEAGASSRAGESGSDSSEQDE